MLIMNLTTYELTTEKRACSDTLRLFRFPKKNLKPPYLHTGVY
jgi:hypothetical protein